MSEELDLHDYMVMLRRRWWLIVSIVILGCCAAYGYGRYVQTPMYQASAKLIMTNMNGADNGKPIDSAAIEANLMMLQTYKDIIRTPVIMKKVAAAHPELGMTAGEMAGKLRVVSSAASQVLSITAQDESYSRAARLVNAVSSAFIEETVLLYRSQDLKMLYEAEIEPEASPNPVNMGLKSVLLLAFAGSLMIAVGISAVLHYFDKKIRTERDVARTLGLHTLMELPLFIEEDGRSRHGRREATRLRLGRAGESFNVPIEK